MSLADNLVEQLAQEYAEKRKRETARRMGRYADDQFARPAGLADYASGSAGVGAEPFEPPATVRFNDLSYESIFPDAFPKVRFGPVDPETQRLAAIDIGAPHGEPPFPGYERGARKAADVGGAVGGVVGQEEVGRKVGEIGYRAIVPSTPAEFASALATGGLFGETTVIGQALRTQARKVGMRVEEYVATKGGQEALDALLKKRGIAAIKGASLDAPIPGNWNPDPRAGEQIPGTPDLPEPKPGGKLPAAPKQFNVYRGTGRAAIGSVYTPPEEGGVGAAMFSNATYYAFDRPTASRYGPDIEQRTIQLSNPMTLRTDAEYRAVSKAAGMRYPNPFSLPPDEQLAELSKLQNYVRAQGHDGIVVRMSDVGDEAKTMRKLFGDDQVIVFNETRAPGAEGAAGGMPGAPPPNLGRTIRRQADDLSHAVNSLFDLGWNTGDSLDVLMRDPEYVQIRQQIPEMAARLRALRDQAAAEGQTASVEYAERRLKELDQFNPNLAHETAPEPPPRIPASAAGAPPRADLRAKADALGVNLTATEKIALDTGGGAEFQRVADRIAAIERLRAKPLSTAADNVEAVARGEGDQALVQPSDMTPQLRARIEQLRGEGRINVLQETMGTRGVVVSRADAPQPPQQALGEAVPPEGAAGAMPPGARAKRYYHGTGTPFEEIEAGREASYDFGERLFGDALYLSPSKNGGRWYAENLTEAGTVGTPHVIPIDVQDARLINMRGKAGFTPWTAERIVKVARQGARKANHQEALTALDEIPTPYWRPHSGNDASSGYDWIASHLPGANEDEQRTYLNGLLQAAGYDGIRHNDPNIGQAIALFNRSKARVASAPQPPQQALGEAVPPEGAAAAPEAIPQDVAPPAAPGGAPPPPVAPPRPVATAGGGAPASPAAAVNPPGSAGNRYLAPLRPFGEVQGEVVTTGNPLARAATRGVNPSVRSDEMGEVLTAYNRQRVSAEGLAETGVRAALDAHAQRLSGAEPVNIGSNGRVKNVAPKSPGSSLNWHDVFERPDNYNLTPAQRAYIDDYHQLTNEVENMRVAAGLKAKAVVRTDGSRYVPRQVDEVRGTKIRRRAKSGLTRHYTEQQGGAAAGEAAGVRYKNPRDTMMIHVADAYREVAEKQLADAIEPLSITPKQLVPEPVRTRMENAVKVRRKAERAVRERMALLRKNLARAADTPRKIQLRKQDLAALEQFRLHDAPRLMEAARNDYQSARQAYTRALDVARNKEVAPGALWGPNQPNEIAISTWRNRMFPREWGDQLTDAIASFGKTGDKQGWLFKGMQFIGDHIRFLSAVGDFAAPLTHGLPTLGRNPVAWGRAALRHYQAFADPAVQGRYVREHLTTFQEMAQHGVPVGDPEFFAALREGQGLNAGQLLEVFGTKGKAGRGALQQAGKQTFGRFGASYNMFLGAARAELWESLAKAIPDQAERGRLIRNMTGGLDSRALGVGADQRGAESMWLAFSPRLLRSTTALIGMLAEPNTAAGREAWRSLAGLAGGAMGLYVVSGLALGKSEEEIKMGLNPLNGKRFLSHQINGDWIGVGGQLRAITQLLAGSIADPKALASRDRFDNPLLQFYQSRGAPAFNITSAAVEGTTGVNADPYNEIDSIPEMFKHIGTSALPFAIQNAIERQEPLTLAAGLAGARTSGPTFSEAGTEAVQAVGGDYRAAMQEATESGDETRIKQVQSAWRRDLSPRLKEIGAYVVPGSPERSPRIEFEQWDRIEALTAKAIAEKQGVAGEYKTVADVRDAYVDRLLPAMLKLGKSDGEARALIMSDFNKLDAVKRVTAAKENYRLDQWRNHPDLLDEADMVGWEQLNEDERKILTAAGR